MTKLYTLILSASIFSLVTLGNTETASAQIQTLDIEMLGPEQGNRDIVTLAPLAFPQPGEYDPRSKIARKSFIGTLLFEKDYRIDRPDGYTEIKTITSSCGITAAYDPRVLQQGSYDVQGYTADHCVMENQQFGFDRAEARFPGAGKTYYLTQDHFEPSRQTNDTTETYPYDWAVVKLPEDAALQAVPLYIGDYEGLVVFEASTPGLEHMSNDQKKTHYLATTQTCEIARRYSDYSSDKVTTCRTTEGMSGGGFFIPGTYELYATLSRIGQESRYSYATLVSAVGQNYDQQTEYNFQVANYHLRGQEPFGARYFEEVYQAAEVLTTTACLTSDGASLVDTLMIQGLPYSEARKLC